MIALALLVFVSGVAVDVCWAQYVACAAKGKRWSAAAWSVGIYLSGAFAVVSYTTDHRLIVPAALGAFFGTALGVKKP